MLNVSGEGSSLGRDSDDYKTGFDESRIGRWSSGGLSNAEITICEDRLSEFMIAKGYSLSYTNSSVISRFLIRSSLPVKLLFGFALNITRFHSLLKSVSRRF